MATTTDKVVNNGVNVEALLDARKALTETPEGAKFQWRATCKWVNGTHSRSTIKGFFGLGVVLPASMTARRSSRDRGEASAPCPTSR